MVAFPCGGRAVHIWQAPAGAITADLVAGTEYAVVGAVSVDRTIGKPRSRLALVNAQSGHEIWSAEYRNSNCCGTPAVGFLPASRQVFASGDELLLVPLGGGPSRHVELDGVTLNAATAAGREWCGSALGRSSTRSWQCRPTACCGERVIPT